MRFAGDALKEGGPYPASGGDEELGSSLEAAVTAGQGEDVAMTRGRALQILNNMSKEAVRKNVTPETFQTALFEAGMAGNSTDYTRRNIRNALKTPLVREAVDNPGLAKELLQLGADRLGGLSLGVNPESLTKYTGLALDVLGEAKKDGILRPDVTHREIEKKVQKPMYGALQDWMKTTARTPGVREVIGRTQFGSGNNHLTYEQKLRALLGFDKGR